MKSFAGTLALLLCMSVVAYVWRPNVESDRLANIASALGFSARNLRTSMTREEMARRFAELDVDGDGMLSLNDVTLEPSVSPKNPTCRLMVLRRELQQESLSTTHIDLLASTVSPSYPACPHTVTDEARVADTAQALHQVVLLAEADIDNDYTASPDEVDALFRRLDAGRDGALTSNDFPEKPLRLVWTTDDNPVRARQVTAFNRLYPKYDLVLDPLVGAADKVIVQCIGGIGPDLFDSNYAFTFMAFVRSGIALDLTEHFAKRGIETETIWPALRPLYVYEGRTYGHPRNASAPAIWFNRRLFDDAGLAYPAEDWTWEELVDTANQLNRRDAAGRPQCFGFLAGWDPYTWYTMIRRFGGAMYTPEGTRCTLDAPQSIAAMQFIQDLMLKHHVMPTQSDADSVASSGGWGRGAITLFGAEKGAMALGGRWWLCLLRDSQYAHLDLGAVPLPAGANAQGLAAGGVVMANRNSDRTEGALLFMEYLSSAAYNELVNTQADGLGPVMAYHYGPYEQAFLHNPAYPDEQFNHVWRDVLEEADPPVYSPYINGQLVDRIVTKHFDFIQYPDGRTTVESLLHRAADEVNQRIVERLRADPELRQKYREAIVNGAMPAWDHPEDAP